MATATNRVSSSALRGESVLVMLDSTETITKLPAITIGQQCTLGSSSFVGFVCSVDYLGNSFEITPRTPVGNLSSSTTPGILTVDEVITIV